MKLIRHKIPAIAAAKGETLRTRQATTAEFPRLLAAKLVEEAGEFAAAPSIEELADVMEALEGLLIVHGWTERELGKARVKKLTERGSFFGFDVLLGPGET